LLLSIKITLDRPAHKNINRSNNNGGLATAQNLIDTAMLICNSSRDLSCEKVARKCRKLPGS